MQIWLRACALGEFLESGSQPRTVTIRRVISAIQMKVEHFGFPPLRRHRSELVYESPDL